jgi:ADP-dependent phosphofructokinase/glucokinase
MLPSELWNIEIDEKTIEEVIKTFQYLVQNRKISPTVMIFAKGLNNDKEILNMLLSYFSNNIESLSESDISETLNSIDHFTFVNNVSENPDNLPEDFVHILEMLEDLTKGENPDIKRFSNSILTKVRHTF